METKTLPLDVEHSGVRLALLSSLIGGGILSYLILTAILNLIFPDGSGGCIAVAGAVLGAAMVGMVTDRVLKRVWPSGRSLQLDDARLRLQDKRKNKNLEITIDWGQRINGLAWRFTVKRGSVRTPKGWIMMGCQLTQDEDQVTLYTFMPSKEADTNTFVGFVQLISRRVLEQGDTPLREVNQMKRLLRAEQDRWIDGAELRKEDFVLLVETLTEKVPDWSKP